MRRRRRRLKSWVKVALFILIICLVFIVGKNILTKPTSKTKKVSKEVTTTKKKDSEEISLVMVGDCLLHTIVYKAADQGDGTYSFKDMFSNIAPLVKGYDLAYYNQESIIGGKKIGLSSYPTFNSPEEIGDDMVDMGFNLVGLANNHTMDKGVTGVTNSVEYWRTKSGVYWTGQALSEEERTKNIRVEEKNGLKYAFLAYTTVTNGLLPPAGKEYMSNVYSDEKAKRDIELIKDKADVIIVAMHWGVEYTNTEVPEQKRIAEYLSSLGVNLIIGAHPHVIEPITYVNDTLVFYSLGNFVSSQDSSDKLTGALASLKIKKKDGKIVFDDIKVNLIYTSFNRTPPYNFKLYPYQMLDSSILVNYNSYYEKYKTILTSEEQTVEVVSLD